MATTELKKFAKRLSFNELVVFLDKSDEVSVGRNTRGNLNPAFVQSMTVSEAVAFGAWDTSRGTMEANVSCDGYTVHRMGDRAYMIVDTGERPAWEAAASESRETMHHWTYEA